jgi:transcriptional regulator GlxA family with amidase domain
VTRVVFVITPGVHLLDLSGAAQVFSTAAEFGFDYRLCYLAETPSVTSAQGLQVQAETRWPDPGPADLLLVPGWGTKGRGHGALSAAGLDLLSSHHHRGGTVASVCSGAFALGRAGLLDGRRCTTHHELQDDLARRHPRAHVVRDVLFTEDDRVVTSAGIASGIDLALHLVATRHGPAAAARVARSMVVYGRRNGDAQQLSPMLRHRAHLNDSVHQVQDLIDSEFDRSLPLGDLAAVAGVSERTLTRAFAGATGMTPLRYQQILRLERAEQLIGRGETVEAAAHSVGFADARMLRRLRSPASSTSANQP